MTTTPYQRHAALGHHMSRYSPEGISIIEECDTCGARFHLMPHDPHPLSLPYMCMGCKCVPCQCRKRDINGTIGTTEDKP